MHAKLRMEREVISFCVIMAPLGVFPFVSFASLVSIG